jgi:hypothetical protein
MTLPSPDWIEKGLAHNAALREAGGLPECERDTAKRIGKYTPRCELCSTTAPRKAEPPFWRIADDRLYCPGCAPFHVEP